ncbi:hypothetical protein BJ508DRAFT_15410 [Ascobolus immersus RN42]|uniref:Uncharacterized protein n=1 Tax=Ascobolus immersus RN42 TaxID=1160509 RepID=A0A3N4HV91_ASCIM|nr:hypothetical protein BJ508DRAFT_15410 [Ascobolus immersus RN42]
MLFGWAVQPISLMAFLLLCCFLTFVSVLVQWFPSFQEYLFPKAFLINVCFKNFFSRGFYISFLGVNFAKDRGVEFVVFGQCFKCFMAFLCLMGDLFSA